MSIHKAMSPNQREGITALSSITGLNEYLTSTSGALNISGSFSVTGGATSANQTNGQQLVQIVDAGGEAATVTGGKLDVNATASLAGSPIPISGAATGVGVAILDGSGNQITSFGGGTQYADGVARGTATGTLSMVDDGTNIQSTKGDSDGTQQVSLTKVGGSAIALGQTTMSASMPITIASNQSALPVTLTSTTITGTVAVTQSTSPWVVSNSVLSVVGNGSATTAQRVTLANDSTGVIATVGAVTSITNALPAGTNVIGHVITDTGSTTAVTGTVTVSGTVTANAGTNLNTSALALETGGNLASVKTNTDNLNLAIGSTTSGQKGNLVLTATTTAAPTYTTAQSNPLSTTTTGLLRVDGSGVTQPVSLTSTTITGTVAVTQSGTWTDTVTQATAANLNATVVGTGTFAVQATLAAETTKVIGTVNQGTSPWVTSNATTSVVGNGASATAQRVTLSNDSTGVIATVGAVTAITNALPTGSNTIGAISNTGFAVTQATGSNLHTVLDSGTLTTLTTLTGTTTLTPGTGATNLGKAEDSAHASGDVGVFALAVRNDNLATSYGADQDYSPIAVDAGGRTMVAQKAATATLANVAGSATSVTLIAANSARIGATITNDSSALLYIKFGTTASTTSYTVVLAGAASAPFSYYEVPAGFTGRIDGIWASATGNARTTEIT